MFYTIIGCWTLFIFWIHILIVHFWSIFVGQIYKRHVRKVIRVMLKRRTRCVWKCFVQCAFDNLTCSHDNRIMYQYRDRWVYFRLLPSIYTWKEPTEESKPTHHSPACSNKVLRTPSTCLSREMSLSAYPWFRYHTLDILYERMMLLIRETGLHIAKCRTSFCNQKKIDILDRIRAIYFK